MSRIVISGFYGFNNAGDEAVLAGLLLGLRSQSDVEDPDVTVLSIDPASSRVLHGVHAVNRYSVGELLRSLATSNLLVSGGGSLLQDVTSAHGIFYYLAVVRLAQLMGKKTMFAAQGIGPLSRLRSRKLTASVANRLDAITVRDRESASFLLSIGVRKPIAVTADPALLLSSNPVQPIGETIGLSMRPWKDITETLVQRVSRSLQVALPSAEIVPLDMYPGHDGLVLRNTLTALGHSPDPILGQVDTSYLSLLNATAACKFVIGMRLHALIFAAACGVPSVALSYDPKIDAFMTQTGQQDMLYSVTSDNESRLLDLISQTRDTWRERKAALAARLPVLRAAARRTTEIALELAALP